jgi:hypothetical protein
MCSKSLATAALKKGAGGTQKVSNSGTYPLSFSGKLKFRNWGSLVAVWPLHSFKLTPSAVEFETYGRFVFKNDVLYAFFMIKNRVKNVATKYR